MRTDRPFKHRCTISPTHRNLECSWRGKKTNTSRRKRIQKSNFAEKVLVSLFWDVEEVADVELLHSNKIQHTSLVRGAAQWMRSGHMPRGVNWQHDSAIVLKLLERPRSFRVPEKHFEGSCFSQYEEAVTVVREWPWMREQVFYRE